MLVCSRLWVSCHDSDPEVVEIANRIWNSLDVNCTVQLALACAAILDNPSDSMQQAVAICVYSDSGTFSCAGHCGCPAAHSPSPTAAALGVQGQRVSQANKL